MTRAFIVLLSLVLAAPLFAQADAVALAAQREQEENIKRLAATVQEVQEAQIKQHESIAGLSREVDKLRGEVAKANNNSATLESLKQLNDQIRRVDESRIADNKRIQEALEQLRKLIVERPAPPSRLPVTDTRPPVVNPSPSNGNGNGTTRPINPNSIEEGFEYVVQSGDRLDKIVAAYRAQGIMVTQKMVMDANPTVKWERLRIGQKIFIPKPK